MNHFSRIKKFPLTKHSTLIPEREIIACVSLTTTLKMLIVNKLLIGSCNATICRKCYMLRFAMLGASINRVLRGNAGIILEGNRKETIVVEFGTRDRKSEG